MARHNKTTPPSGTPPSGAPPLRAPRTKASQAATEAGAGGDETLETLKLWWHDNGKYFIASAVIGLAAVGGWRLWEYNHQMTMRDAAGLYAELLEQVESGGAAAEAQAANADDGDADDGDAAAEDAAPPEAQARAAAERSFDDLRDGFANTPYPVLAALALARLHVESGDLAAAAERLRWAADNGDQQQFKALALVRLMRVLLEMGELEEAEDVLIDNDFPSGLEEVAGEINGDILYARRRSAQAVAAYREALSKLSDQQGFIEMKLQELGAPASAADAPERAPPVPAEVPDDSGVPNIMQ